MIHAGMRVVCAGQMGKPSLFPPLLPLPLGSFRAAFYLLFGAKTNPGSAGEQSRGSRRSTCLRGGWQRSDSTIVPESAVVLKRVRGYRIVLRTAFIPP